MAYAFPPFACPAQTSSVRYQLDHGIRALDLEAHVVTGDGDGSLSLALCLGSCDSGETPIDSALQDVSAFLAVNPREVVTLLIEGGIPADLLQAALAARGLDKVAWSKGATDPWPTLDAMIGAGKRVVVLADVTGSAPSFMLPLWSYVNETGRAFTTVASMTCDVTRGASSAPLYLLNEFLVDGEGGDPASEGGLPLAAGCDDPSLAHVANADPFFTNRVTACTRARGIPPTFVSVDDFEDGALFWVVRALDL
jgi:hypothetical protein